MIDYILSNKEWIFSGIGGSAVLLACSWLARRYGRASKSVDSAPSPQSALRVELVSAPSPPMHAIRAESEVAGIVKRFNRVLVLMNAQRTHNPYSIASLAQRMNLRSVGELESVFLGGREPSFEFIDRFCACFGVNRRWLSEGKGEPFSDPAGTHYDPLRYLDEIIAAQPERIYFIRSRSPVGEVFILLRLSDCCYRIISRVWHISDHVGTGGESQIFGFYQLILALRDHDYAARCGGRVLSEDAFSSLLSGAIFPGSIIDFPSRECPWWDDFTDVFHQYPIALSYESSYGSGFMRAQQIVRWKLEDLAQREAATPVARLTLGEKGAE